MFVVIFREYLLFVVLYTVKNPKFRFSPSLLNQKLAEGSKMSEENDWDIVTRISSAFSSRKSRKSRDLRILESSRQLTPHLSRVKYRKLRGRVNSATSES